MKNEDQKEKRAGIGFLLVSLCFYLAAVMEFTGTGGGNGVVNLCLGSAFLCIASTHFSKGKDQNGKNQ